MRIAATADIHFSPQSYDRIREPLAHVRDEADVLVIAGDLTNYVQAGLDETLKPERALSMLRTPKTVIVTHYAPIPDTVQGEPPEIWPYMGSSRFSEVIDRHQAAIAFHGHAHHGKLAGKTTGGVQVYNVALSLLMGQDPPKPYRVFDI